VQDNNFEVILNFLLPRTEADCRCPVYIRLNRAVGGGGGDGHVYIVTGICKIFFEKFKKMSIDLTVHNGKVEKTLNIPQPQFTVIYFFRSVFFAGSPGIFGFQTPNPLENFWKISIPNYWDSQLETENNW
jgi:hypothetical protein